MKRTLALFCIIILILPFCINATAISSPSSLSYVEYFDDGSYITITISESSPFPIRSENTKTGSKTTTYTGTDGIVKWESKLTGTFSYNGTSATCTSSNITYSIKDSSWDIISAIPSRENNKAIGDIIVKQYLLGIPVNTYNYTIVISCSPTGVLS